MRRDVKSMTLAVRSQRPFTPSTTSSPPSPTARYSAWPMATPHDTKGTAPRAVSLRGAARVAGRDSPLSHGAAAAYRSLIGSPGSGVGTLLGGRSGRKLAARQIGDEQGQLEPAGSDVPCGGVGPGPAMLDCRRQGAVPLGWPGTRPSKRRVILSQTPDTAPAATRRTD